MTAASDSRLRTFVRSAAASEQCEGDLSPLLNASVVVARQHMAAKKLSADYESVLRARDEHDKHARHGSSPTTERAYFRALEAFTATAATALGIDASKPRREPALDCEERYSPVPPAPRSR